MTRWTKRNERKRKKQGQPKNLSWISKGKNFTCTTLSIWCYFLTKIRVSYCTINIDLLWCWLSRWHFNFIREHFKRPPKKGICFFSSPPHQKIEKLITVIHVKPTLNFGCILYKLSFWLLYYNWIWLFQRG